MRKFKRRDIIASGASVFALPFLKQARAADDVTFGWLSPLSGPQEMLGNYIKMGAEIGRDYINAQGGIAGRKIKLVFRDTKANAKEAVAVARELMGTGINLSLGAVTSPGALALGPLMQQMNGVHITCGASTDKINHESYSPNIFRTGDYAYPRNRSLALQMLQAYPEIKVWGAITPDHEYGRSVWAVFKDTLIRDAKRLTGRDVDILDPVLVPYGASDYKPYITKFMSSRAEGMFIGNYGGDTITMYQQALPYGLFDKAKAIADSGNEFMIAQTMKAQSPTYWGTVLWYYADKSNKLSTHLFNEFVKRKNDKTPGSWASEAFSALLAYKAAIEKNGGSFATADVIKSLKGLTFDSPTGSRTIRAEDNQGVKDVDLVKIEPSKTSEVGFEVTKTFKIPRAEAYSLPPAPGKKLELRG